MTLRRRILMLATGLTALVLILFAVPLAIVFKQSASDRVVRETQYLAQGVADYLSTGSSSGAQITEYVARVNSRTDAAITVLLPDGSAIGAPLPDDAPERPTGASQSEISTITTETMTTSARCPCPRSSRPSTAGSSTSSPTAHRAAPSCAPTSTTAPSTTRSTSGGP